MAEDVNFHPKGVLLDIDKTMTNSKREITGATIAAIRAVTTASIHCGVATGRHFAAIKNYVLPLFPQDCLHITSGGGQIVTSLGKIVWKKLIRDETAGQLIKTVEDLGGAAIVGTGSTLYITKKAYENITTNPWNIDRQLFNPNEKYEFSLISVVQLNPEVKNYINSLKNLTVKFLTSVSGKEYFDITTKGVNKATTAKIWAELSGIKMAEILAVGDGNNDYDLLSAVGYGVAMGNSPDYLKAAAKKVIGTVDEDGLAMFLNSLV